MTHEEIADGLDKAAEAVEARPWGGEQGGSWMTVMSRTASNTGPLCLEGGIQAATGIETVGQELRSCPLYRAVQRYLYPHGVLVGPMPALWVWNDEPGRTQQGVIDLLRAVAKHERGLAEGLDL